MSHPDKISMLIGNTIMAAAKLSLRVKISGKEFGLAAEFF